MTGFEASTASASALRIPSTSSLTTVRDWFALSREARRSQQLQPHDARGETPIRVKDASAHCHDAEKYDGEDNAQDRLLVPRRSALDRDGRDGPLVQLLHEDATHTHQEAERYRRQQQQERQCQQQRAAATDCPCGCSALLLPWLQGIDARLARVERLLSSAGAAGARH